MVLNTRFVFSGGSGPCPGSFTNLGIVGIKSTTGVPLTFPSPITPSASMGLHVHRASFISVHNILLYTVNSMSAGTVNNLYLQPHITPCTQNLWNFYKIKIMSVHVNFPFYISLIFFPGLIFFHCLVPHHLEEYSNLAQIDQPASQAVTRTERRTTGLPGGRTRPEGPGAATRMRYLCWRRPSTAGV